MAVDRHLQASSILPWAALCMGAECLQRSLLRRVSFPVWSRKQPLRPALKKPHAVVAMRAVIQRVKSASVSVDGQLVSSIGPGLLCFMGIRAEDTAEDAEYVARKVLNARFFQNPDSKRQWDRSVSAYQRFHAVEAST